MKKSIIVFLIICAAQIKVCGQKPVPVYEEPRHKPVFVNEFVRIIQAKIKDQDTSLFHIHATPSAFVFVDSTSYDNQVLGEGWTHPSYPKGYAWYSSFANGPSTHRVAAHPQQEIFAYDVELLSKYDTTDPTEWRPLSKDTIFISDKAAGYKMKLSRTNIKIDIKGRGPIVAILLNGKQLEIRHPLDRQKTIIKEKGYAYLNPMQEYTIALKGASMAELILFEVR